jgi:hypothetical protein
MLRKSNLMQWFIALPLLHPRKAWETRVRPQRGRRVRRTPVAHGNGLRSHLPVFAGPTSLGFCRSANGGIPKILCHLAEQNGALVLVG